MATSFTLMSGRSCVVTEGISFPWPPDASLLLSPQSPLNPHFFAYGSLPIYLLRACASLAGLFNPALATLNDSSYIVGRVLSALFDLGSVYLLYRLGRKLYDPWVGVLAAALLALTVLHIQLSHFYAVDTVLAFLVLLTVTLAAELAQRPTARRGLGVGVAWGMALATKVSAAPLFVPIALAWLLGTWAAQAKGEGGREGDAGPSRDDDHRSGGPGDLPRLWSPMRSWMSLPLWWTWPTKGRWCVGWPTCPIRGSSSARCPTSIPYSRPSPGPWASRWAWQASGRRSLLWCRAWPCSSRAVGRRARGALWMPLSWSITYFALTGSFHTKFLRYMLPIIPFLVLWAAWALLRRCGSRDVRSTHAPPASPISPCASYLTRR